MNINSQANRVRPPSSQLGTRQFVPQRRAGAAVDSVHWVRQQPDLRLHQNSAISSLLVKRWVAFDHLHHSNLLHYYSLVIPLLEEQIQFCNWDNLAYKAYSV